MFGFAILDVAIGLIFVYLILSLICTMVNEIVASMVKMRSNTLAEGVQNLLGSDLAAKLYAHPAVSGLSKPGAKPGYISPQTFALALVDTVTDGTKNLRDAVNALPDGAPKKWLDAAIRAGGEDAAAVRKTLEQWYNDAMDRVQGWYKRKMMVVTAVVAGAVTFFANADTFAMAQRLWLDPTLRSAVVEQAKVRSQKPAPPAFEYQDPDTPDPSPPVRTASSSSVSDEERKLLGQVVGWGAEIRDLNRRLGQGDSDTFPIRAALSNLGTLIVWLLRQVLLHSIGWILTGCALMLGAPFWFDQLKNLVNLRSAGRRR